VNGILQKVSLNEVYSVSSWNLNSKFSVASLLWWSGEVWQLCLQDVCYSRRQYSALQQQEREVKWNEMKWNNKKRSTEIRRESIQGRWECKW